ncbi:MAG: glycosyltransferase family protein [Opitutales bacterium]
MKFVFFVQGEGRGHLTQAISLQRILESAGHRVCRICVGLPHNRRLPEFAQLAFRGRLETYRGPALSYCRRRGLTHVQTTARFLRDLPALTESYRQVAACLRREQPERIVNFFEPVAGVHFRLKEAPAPVVSLGHQFLLLHPAFRLPPGTWLERRSTLNLIRLVGGTSLKLALSFREQPSDPKQRIQVVPPLLRPALRRCNSTDVGPVVAYLLNAGYVADLERAQALEPHLRVRCFSGFSEAELTSRTTAVHREPIHGERYLQAVTQARGLVSTAGFEAVAEGAYLGKPIVLMPVDGHFEQRANALDATRAGLAHAQSPATLNLGPLNTPPPVALTQTFRAWCDHAPGAYLEALTGQKANEPAVTGEPVLFPD